MKRRTNGSARTLVLSLPNFKGVIIKGASQHVIISSVILG